MDDKWQEMVIDSLNRIEKKLDSKVDEKVCQIKHSRAKGVQTWLSIILSSIALLGMLYTGIKILDIPQQDRVTNNGQ
jgi:hypothetical protein